MNAPSETLSSFRRLHGSAFATTFYDRLLASDPAIARAFAKTNFDRQHELFEHGVMMLLKFASGSALGTMAIERLGTLHGPGKLAIAPNLYSKWIDSLVATARELDPEWNDDLERAWRRDLSRGIDVMIRAYAKT